jgi:hypothetical protein
MRSLLIVVACTAGLMSSAGQTTIIEPSAPSRNVDLRRVRDVGRPFEPTARCSGVRSQGATIAAILGPETKAFLVSQYDKAQWPDLDIVKDYLGRVLVAMPEGGTPSPHVIWAERVAVEISIAIEFRDGQRRRMEFGDGYAHFEDEAGCEWWARYLGGDRSKWTVRR